MADTPALRRPGYRQVWLSRSTNVNNKFFQPLIFGKANQERDDFNWGRRDNNILELKD